MQELLIDNSYGLAELQGKLLELMKFVDQTARQEKIRYSLTGGSLLGAIRHGGFIPWDDDFDIMLSRPEYDKFVQYMNTHDTGDYIMEQDQWVLRVRKGHKTNGPVPSIDLFVVDRVPKSRMKAKWQILRLRVLQGLLRTDHDNSKHGFVYRVLIWGTGLLGKMCKKDRLFKKYDAICRWGYKDFPLEDASAEGYQLAILDDKFKLLPLKYSRNLMDGYEDHPFADTSFMIISAYKEYLTTQYGDYMTPPQEADRTPQHLD